MRFRKGAQRPGYVIERGFSLRAVGAIDRNFATARLQRPRATGTRDSRPPCDGERGARLYRCDIPSAPSNGTIFSMIHFRIETRTRGKRAGRRPDLTST